MKTDFRDRDHLSTLKGGRTKPRAGRRKALNEDEQVYCWQCSADNGIETSAVTQVVVAPRRKPDGKLTGGTKVWVCSHCLARGKITELIR